MSRPNKQGLDYFPLNTDLLSNLKIRRLINAQGVDAIAVIIELLCRIYGDRGYYIGQSEDLAFLISDALRGGVRESKVREIIKAAIAFNIFDANMAKDHGVLTSRSIQETFFEATKKRKGVQCDGRFLLISINSELMGVNSELTLVNVDHNEQSKVKESKVNKSKVKESKEKKRSPDTVTALYMNRFGDITQFTADVLQSMVNEFGEQAVLDAMHLAIKKGINKINYVQGILRNKGSEGCGSYGITQKVDWVNEPDEL